jgi:serine/threonine protein kinase
MHVDDTESPLTHFTPETVGYLPPEVLNGENYTPAADVWALGVLLFQMASGRLPFSSVDPDRIIKEVSFGRHIALPAGKYSPRFKAILSGMMKVDPKQRLKVDHILMTPQAKMHAREWLNSNIFQVQFKESCQNLLIMNEMTKCLYRSKLTEQDINLEYQNYV